MSGPETIVTAGFMPLLDSVLLVLAQEKGFAAEEGIELHLMRESSWANIRDRVGVGHFEIAQMLAPMPIAASLGLSPIAMPFITPMVLGLGNNAVTVSGALWDRMAAFGAQADLDPGTTGSALNHVVAEGGTRLRFGVVHQNSAHNFELRYWMAASGIRPDIDVEILVLPPPLLPDALGSGVIDGYCVGEPWNSVGVSEKGAHIATVKAAIWKLSPDKVLGMSADWAERNPDTLSALIRATHKAALWCADEAHHGQIAAIMAGPAYLNQPAELVLRALGGQLQIGGGVGLTIPDFFVPLAHHANFPWKSHALWFYSQMARWGDVAPSAENAAKAAASFRPDLYRKALAPEGVIMPPKDYKTDTSFFDEVPFDPDQIDRYIAAQAR